ncbi:MAG: AAA family ATPase, partial [Clostridia bacterium]|nr:AAA family ATPase [Clostridia bacterium]
DEIDAVGRQRGAGLGGGNDEREQTLNQLLVQMDGFEENENIIVMAATNRADILDPALMRPGRFDRQIYINVPDVRGREEILKVHSRNKPFSSDVNFKHIARITSGFTGADLENLLNESAIFAARANRKEITQEDINNGIVKVAVGPQKKSLIISERDKNITAFHEAGHAVVGKFVKNNNPVHEVSIIPRGGAAGYTLTRPDKDDNHVTKGMLLDQISMLLAGRMAETLFLDDITTGASSDLQRATSLARHMVVDYGMSEAVGLVNMGSQTEVFIGRDYQTKVNYSDKEASIIDAEIRKIIDECSEVARNILSKKAGVVKNMVEVLLQKETIYSDEVDMLIDGKSADKVIAFMDNKQNKDKGESKEKSVDEILAMAEERAIAKNSQSAEKSANDTNVSHETVDERGSKKTTRKTTAKKSTVSKTTSKKASSTKQKKTKKEDDEE